jgi:hypothetical protein
VVSSTGDFLYFFLVANTMLNSQCVCRKQKGMQESVAFIYLGFQNYKQLFLSSLYISPGIFNIAKFNHVHMVSNDKFSSDYFSPGIFSS